MARARRWTWTLNNPTPQETERLDLIIDHLKGETEEAPEAAGEVPFLSTCRYMIYGREVAPTTGCVHYQGYVEFTSVKSMGQVKQLISPRLHVEKSKGTPEQNITYCQKDGDYISAGEPTKHGKRNDLKEIQQMVEDGATDLDIAKVHFGVWTRVRASVKEYRQMLTLPAAVAKYQLDTFPEEWIQNYQSKTQLSIILWGDSGIGKTHFAKALLPGALLVSHVDDLRHFQKNVHPGIIFDDMEFKHIPRTGQIHLVDSDDDRSIHCRYSCASIPAGTRKIFTTNEFDGLIFDLSDRAIRRRVDVIKLEGWLE